MKAGMHGADSTLVLPRPVPSPSLPPRPPACALPCQQEVPAEVPQHIFSEVLRLRCLGTAASNAKKEFGLTDRELRDMPHVEKSMWVGVEMWG